VNDYTLEEVEVIKKTHKKYEEERKAREEKYHKQIEENKRRREFNERSRNRGTPSKR